MTTFKHPLIVGDTPTGNPAANNQGFVTLTQRIGVSAGQVTGFKVLPPNSRLLPCTRAIVTEKITGSAGGVRLTLGKSAGTNEYGQVAVSASGAYDFVFTGAIVSAAGTVACDLQTISSASAEAFAGIKLKVDLIYTVTG